MLRSLLPVTPPRRKPLSAEGAPLVRIALLVAAALALACAGMVAALAVEAHAAANLHADDDLRTIALLLWGVAALVVAGAVALAVIAVRLTASGETR